MEKDSNNFQYIKNPDLDVQKKAIQGDTANVEFIKNPSEELLKFALAIDPFVIEYFKKPSEELQLYALQINPDTFNFINNPSERIVKEYGKLKSNPEGVIDIVSEKEWNYLVELVKANKPIVITEKRSTCGLCKAFTPKLEKIAKRYRRVHYFNIVFDVGYGKTAWTKYGYSSFYKRLELKPPLLPLVRFIENGKIVDGINSPDTSSEVVNKIKKLKGQWDDLEIPKISISDNKAIKIVDSIDYFNDNIYQKILDGESIVISLLSKNNSQLEKNLESLQTKYTTTKFYIIYIDSEIGQQLFDIYELKSTPCVLNFENGTYTENYNQLELSDLENILKRE